MHAPAQTILWQIFWRARWGFVTAGVYLLASIVFCQVLPRHWTMPVAGNAVSVVGWFFGATCLFINVLLITPFGMNDGDARNLTFARNLFVLPVRTSALVAWPLISGCVTVAVFWLLTASLVFRPTGIAAPLWFPAAALALFLATFQALSWTPFAQRWLHCVLTVAVLIMPLFVLMLMVLLESAWGFQVNELAATGLVTALIPLAYLAALSGVSRARRGDFYDWRAWGRLVERLSQWRPPALHPFRSADRAQVWYECRAHLIVPVFIACMMTCFLFIPALEPHNVALGWRLLMILLAAPVLVGMLAGGSLGSLVDPTSQPESRSFVLARPVTTLSLVRGKLMMAALMTAAIWLLFLAYTALLLLRPGFIQSIQQVANGVPLWKVIVYPTVIVGLLIAFTWKSIVETLWVGLTGRKWLEHAFALAISSVFFSGLVGGVWMISRPDWQAAAIASLPWFMGLLLALKLAAAAYVVTRLLRTRLTTARGVSWMLGTWLAAVCLLSALAIALLPSEFAVMTTLIPGIVLLIPFARLAGAPLGLHWNRHR